MPRGAGFTPDELRALAGELAGTDTVLASALVTAIKKATRGTRVNPATTRLLMLAGELELALNDIQAAREMEPRRRRR